MSAQIHWTYVWNDTHAFFHHILQDTMKEPQLKLEPVHIDSAEPSKFEITFSQKVSAIIEMLKSALERNDAYAIFTDVDVIV